MAYIWKSRGEIHTLLPNIYPEVRRPENSTDPVKRFKQYWQQSCGSIKTQAWKLFPFRGKNTVGLCALHFIGNSIICWNSKLDRKQKTLPNACQLFLSSVSNNWKGITSWDLLLWTPNYSHSTPLHCEIACLEQIREEWNGLATWKTFFNEQWAISRNEISRQTDFLLQERLGNKCKESHQLYIPQFLFVNS